MMGRQERVFENEAGIGELSISQFRIIRPTG
jgi:hypothetical protein